MLCIGFVCRRAVHLKVKQIDASLKSEFEILVGF